MKEYSLQENKVGKKRLKFNWLLILGNLDTPLDPQVLYETEKSLSDDSPASMLVTLLQQTRKKFPGVGAHSMRVSQTKKIGQGRVRRGSSAIKPVVIE